LKIFFNRVPRKEPYGGGNQFLIGITEKLEKLGHQITYHLEDSIDLIFLMDPRPGDIGYSIEHVVSYKSQNPQVKILHRVNECDKRKGTDFMDGLLMASMNIADEVVFISKWLKDYFFHRGFTDESHVIYNGCNSDHFRPLDSELNNNRKIKLVTHHWSDNWLKGFDLYTELDQYLVYNNSKYEFTYVGRYYKDYKTQATKIIEPLRGKPLGDELRKHDIYITASRWEPCGMHHVEGSASGLPVIYHHEGGGINELCQNHGRSFKAFNEFLSCLDDVVENYNDFKSKIDYEFLSIDRCLKSYVEIIDSMT